MAAGGWARQHLDGINATRHHQGWRHSHQTSFRDQLYCAIMFSNVGSRKLSMEARGSRLSLCIDGVSSFWQEAVPSFTSLQL
jgi:hypothetical protein